MSIATSVLDTVEAEAAKRPGSKFVKLGLRVGELSALDRDAFTFGWEVLTRETKFEGLVLDIEMVPWRNLCPACGENFQVRDYQTQCPRCGEAVTRCVAGEELDIAFIEIEEEAQQT